MIRSQAKEISAKDKEIVRLTKEICKLMEMNQMKQGLSMIVQDEPSVPLPSKGPKTDDTPKLDLNKEYSRNSSMSPFKTLSGFVFS